MANFRLRDKSQEFLSTLHQIPLCSYYFSTKHIKSFYHWIIQWVFLKTKDILFNMEINIVSRLSSPDLIQILPDVPTISFKEERARSCATFSCHASYHLKQFLSISLPSWYWQFSPRVQDRYFSECPSGWVSDVSPWFMHCWQEHCRNGLVLDASFRRPMASLHPIASDVNLNHVLKEAGVTFLQC